MQAFGEESAGPSWQLLAGLGPGFIEDHRGLNFRGWEWLERCSVAVGTALAGDLSSGPSTHVRWLSIAWNLNSWVSGTFTLHRVPALRAHIIPTHPDSEK